MSSISQVEKGIHAGPVPSGGRSRNPPRGIVEKVRNDGDMSCAENVHISLDRARHGWPQELVLQYRPTRQRRGQHSLPPRQARAMGHWRQEEVVRVSPAERTDRSAALQRETVPGPGSAQSHLRVLDQQLECGVAHSEEDRGKFDEVVHASGHAEGLAAVHRAVRHLRGAHGSRCSHLGPRCTGGPARATSIAGAIPVPVLAS